MAPATVRELLTQYAAENLQIKGSSLAALSYSVSALDRFCGHPCFVAELSKDMLLRFTRDSINTRSARTAKNRRADILTLWRFAADRGLLPEPGRIPTVRVPRRLPIAWREQEVSAIVAACRDLPGVMRGTTIPRCVWWESLVLCCLFTGCRISAALHIKTADVDLRRRTLILRSESAKTGIEQSLRIHPQLAESLATIYNRRNEFVWPWHCNRRKLWGVFRSILNAAKLPSDRYHMFHAFRRTCFTWTTKAAGLAVARNQLGHKTDMTAFYLDTSQLDDIQAADVLPRIDC